jgi:RNA polymerase sigma factor (sigma-70 family)
MTRTKRDSTICTLSTFASDNSARLPRRESAVAIVEPSRTIRDSWLADLSVPITPLLAPEDEVRVGRRIHAGLARASWLIAQHPIGARLWTRRLVRVAEGEERVFHWHDQCLPVGRDAPRAEGLLAALLSECSALGRGAKEARPSSSRRFSSTGPAKKKGTVSRSASQSKRADSTPSVETRRSLVSLLRAYPLEPELLLDWSDEIQRVAPPETGNAATDAWASRLARRIAAVATRLRRDRDQITSANLRLVLREVLRFRTRGSLSRSDLFQEGFLGVQKAALRFDPSRRLRFSTYAVYWIRQSIRHGVVHTSRMIRVPERAQEQIRRYTHGESIPMDSGEAERVIRLMQNTALFSATVIDDEGGLENAVSGSLAPRQVDSMYQESLPAAVEKALEGLSERERCVLRHRFGLGGVVATTLEKLGAELRISRERVRQIEQQALHRLRKNVALGEIYDHFIELIQACYSRVLK